MADIFAVKALLMVIAVSILLEKTEAQDWNYLEQEDWPVLCQEGKKQTPINIRRKSAKNTYLPPLKLQNYDKKVKAVLENNGHAVALSLADTNNVLPTVRGGPLSGNYTFSNIHFHWDSEHTIDGYRYPLEAHFVHYKTDLGSVDNALGSSTGLVVFGVFYKEALPNPQIDDVVDNVRRVSRAPDKPIELPKAIDIGSFLPKSFNNYFTYQGSLTTPDCNEAVTWIVFDELVPISKEQLARISNIYTQENRLLRTNYRKLQDLNGRSVFYAL